MTHLLRIDSSPRGEHSHSRRMTREFVEAWKRTHRRVTVNYRDIGRNPVPHVDQEWIAAASTLPEKRTPQMWKAIRVSDQLVDEFLAADVYVIGVPIYNFSIPSTFEAYIDQIIRVGRTWAYEPEDSQTPQKPLVHGKKMFIITTRGDARYGTSSSDERLNRLELYLRSVFGFIGINDITFITVENDEFTDSIKRARVRIALEFASEKTELAPVRCSISHTKMTEANYARSSLPGHLLLEIE